eukprot:CAMPEP_0196807274 /NCGR_PEP_ID=MMETSP1362-20130617/7232_1 /TAXON_ID=163516 /ORGANISM="Leptocylindrus danicus, Strain CCMP1856" /LENGTH=203 /DNA_ID=CAMNT_0042181117 /DNA_START=116 /DNA_END=728 /DNA_ORIENTATION=-
MVALYLHLLAATTVQVSLGACFITQHHNENTHKCNTTCRPTSAFLLAAAKTKAEANTVDYQSSFGRGSMHLSAILNEGDAVVYQTGTWEVDGVEVGTGEAKQLCYAKIDTLQLVWTHDCEHGQIRGLLLTLASYDEGSEVSTKGSNDSGNNLEDEYEFVEFGPEQLLARLPVEWEGCSGNAMDCDVGRLLVSVPAAYVGADDE